MENLSAKFAELIRVIDTLRDPDLGCPWLLEQNRATLVPYMLEEAYEATRALQQDDDQHIADELGDVLLQVILHARLGAEAGTFDIGDVIIAITEKLKRRHPHVFAKPTRLTIPEVVAQWQRIKEQEGKQRGAFDRLHHVVPATTKAAKIGTHSRGVGFDWDKPSQVLEKLESEWFELKEAYSKMESKHPQENAEVLDEISDMYFTLAQLCRHLGIEPEVVADAGNQKFLKRFAWMEQACRDKDIELGELSAEQKEALWRQAKLSLNQESSPQS